MYFPDNRPIALRGNVETPVPASAESSIPVPPRRRFRRGPLRDALLVLGVLGLILLGLFYLPVPQPFNDTYWTDPGASNGVGCGSSDAFQISGSWSSSGGAAEVKVYGGNDLVLYDQTGTGGSFSIGSANGPYWVEGWAAPSNGSSQYTIVTLSGDCWGALMDPSLN